MKSILKTVLLLLLPFLCHAQELHIDNLKTVLQNATTDSARYVTTRAMYLYYEETNRDSALRYAEISLSLAQKNNKRLCQAVSLNIKGYQLCHLGRYAASLQCLLEAFKIAEDPANTEDASWPVITSFPSPGNTRMLVLALTHHIFAVLMEQTQNTEQQIFHFREALRISKEIQNSYRLLLANMNLGNSYLQINNIDSAFSFEMEAERVSRVAGLPKYRAYILSVLGDIYLKKGDSARAEKYFRDGALSGEQQNNMTSLARNNIRLIQFFIHNGEKDSVLIYAQKNLRIIESLGRVAGQTGIANNMGTAYENLSIGYKLNNRTDSAFKYQGLALQAKDSLFRMRIKSLSDFQNLLFNEQLRLQNVEKEKVVYQNKIRTWFLLAGIAVLLLLAIIFYWNNLQKHKANLKIELAYDNLKSTQQQLIQSEKMASLGTLTAGIAHEIQNPLNFVNNFSEVNKELIAELKTEAAKFKDDRDYKLEGELLNDIDQNLDKINYHGKRAEAIVKGMLQHSRTSNGAKEATDVNALADEYLRLAYHGIRAKDHSFNVTLKTDFDKTIGTIKIIPQDIGRVLLNLYNNAFYSVNEKIGQVADSYEPTVSLNTKKSGHVILITVRDNGNGIPENIIDKIFQPFFTTKPTGQGTGLGLSLSYDIIKAHGGEIKVESKREEFTEFTISLPC